MGKHLVSSRHSTVQVQDNNPGCMWGILQILDNHHWHSVKKVFPHKKHYGGKHARYKRKTILYNHGITEDQQVGNAEAEPLLVRQHSKKVSAAGKSSPRSHRKGLQTEDRSKDENSNARILSFHAGPELQRVNSIHHLESSDKSLPSKANATMDYSRQNQTASEYALHQEKDDKTTKAALNQKLMQGNNLKRDISNKFKEHTDVLEVFRMEKDLLLNFFRELDIGGKSFQQASNTQARLTKSGSFPLAKPSHMRNISTSTLKHKQTEIWTFPKGEKLLADLKSVPSDHGVDSAKKQKSGYSSRSSQGFYHKGWNQLVLRRFKVIKQKIKHVLLEFTKNGYQSSVEAIHHRGSSECGLPNNGKEVPQSLKDGGIEECIESSSPNETKASDYDSNKHEVQCIRRTSSLNESLHRYTHLFEQSFGKDNKWHNSKSKSLKLRDEDKIHMGGYAPKLPRRNLSLPNVESLGFFLHEAFDYTNDPGLPGRTSVDHNTNVETDIFIQRKSVSLSVNKDTPLDPITESETQEVAESSGRDENCRPLSGLILARNDKGVTTGHSGEILKPSVEDESFHQEKEEINMTIYPNKDVMTVLDTSCEDSATSHEEGTEAITAGSSMDESKIDLLGPGSLCNADVIATAKGTNNNHFQLFEQDTENNLDFKYVKDILEFTSFMGNEHTQMWQTVEQPLKPSLFKDLEASLLQEIVCSGEEVSNSCDHLLLFYLVNEVLLEIYERSSTYFPRPFSFNLSLHPMPKGHHLLKEVWARVNSYMSLKPELDQTLDDVVGRDLAKNNSWMNLQREEEYVALELEEMIMEDLLDEVIYS